MRLFWAQRGEPQPRAAEAGPGGGPPADEEGQGPAEGSGGGACWEEVLKQELWLDLVEAYVWQAELSFIN